MRFCAPGNGAGTQVVPRKERGEKFTKNEEFVVQEYE
jgi:hypothetical protein